MKNISDHLQSRMQEVVVSKEIGNHMDKSKEVRH